MKFYALVLVAALNPLVMRTPEPNGNVPADCEAGNDAPLPRIVVRTAEPEDAPPPRVDPGSPGTRYDLRALQNAIARNDRAAFDAELAGAKAGGAQVRVYEDVARLWDAQFESPFFAEGSAAHRIATQYPGYEAAVRTQVYTDAAGRKFYPAAESRAFVAKQAGVTLASTGRVAKTPTNVSIAPTPKPGTPSTKTAGQPANRTTRQPSRTPSNRATEQPSNRATRQPSNRSPRKTVPRDTPPPRPSPDPSAARAAAATEPAPVVPQVGNTSSTQAPSAAGSVPPAATTATTATETTATDTMATDTMVTDTATDTATDTTSTDTAVTATDVPATTTGAPAKTPRRIILPAILILIGLGVLILLFRAR